MFRNWRKKGAEKRGADQLARFGQQQTPSQSKSVAKSMHVTVFGPEGVIDDLIVPKSESVRQFKNRLQVLTGASNEAKQKEILVIEGRILQPADNDKPLSFFSAADEARINQWWVLEDAEDPRNDPKQPISIRIQSKDYGFAFIDIMQSETVLKIKQKVQALFKIPLKEIHLFHGIHLDDSCTLAQYNVVDYSEIFLDVGKPRIVEDLKNGVHLNIQTQHETFMLQLSEDDLTVLELKLRIEAKRSLPVDKQQLAFCRESLKDTKIYRDYKIKSGDTLELTVYDENQTKELSKFEDEFGALPPGWERRVTKDSRAYYANLVTETTTWTRPTEPAQSAALGKSNPGSISKQQTEEEFDGSSPVHHIQRTFPSMLPEGWVECIDDNTGDKFYANVSTGFTQWDRPIAGQVIEQIGVQDTTIHEEYEDKFGSLPDGWVSCVDDDTGDTYYAEVATGFTQWERPSALATQPLLVATQLSVAEEVIEIPPNPTAATFNDEKQNAQLPMATSKNLMFLQDQAKNLQRAPSMILPAYDALHEVSETLRDVADAVISQGSISTPVFAPDTLVSDQDFRASEMRTSVDEIQEHAVLLEEDMPESHRHQSIAHKISHEISSNHEEIVDLYHSELEEAVAMPEKSMEIPRPEELMLTATPISSELKTVDVPRIPKRADSIKYNAISRQYDGVELKEAGPLPLKSESLFQSEISNSHEPDSTANKGTFVTSIHTLPEKSEILPRNDALNNRVVDSTRTDPLNKKSELLFRPDVENTREVSPIPKKSAVLFRNDIRDASMTTDAQIELVSQNNTDLSKQGEANSFTKKSEYLFRRDVVAAPPHETPSYENPSMPGPPPKFEESGILSKKSEVLFRNDIGSSKNNSAPSMQVDPITKKSAALFRHEVQNPPPEMCETPSFENPSMPGPPPKFEENGALSKESEVLFRNDIGSSQRNARQSLQGEADPFPKKSTVLFRHELVPTYPKMRRTPQYDEISIPGDRREFDVLPKKSAALFRTDITPTNRENPVNEASRPPHETVSVIRDDLSDNNSVYSFSPSQKFASNRKLPPIPGKSDFCDPPLKYEDELGVLPYGWEIRMNHSIGKTFYANVFTKRTQWYRPTDADVERENRLAIRPVVPQVRSVAPSIRSFSMNERNLFNHETPSISESQQYAIGVNSTVDRIVPSSPLVKSMSEGSLPDGWQQLNTAIYRSAHIDSIRRQDN